MKPEKTTDEMLNSILCPTAEWTGMTQGQQVKEVLKIAAALIGVGLAFTAILIGFILWAGK